MWKQTIVCGTISHSKALEHAANAGEKRLLRTSQLNSSALLYCAVPFRDLLGQFQQSRLLNCRAHSKAAA